jgi:RHS repeat-associated protein
MQQKVFYNSFNSPYRIEEGTSTLGLIYRPSEQRKKTILTTGGNTPHRYFLGNYEKTVDQQTNASQEIHYIGGGDGLAAIYSSENGNPGALHYVFTDHLGSITMLTDSAGNMEVNQNFDAWGRERDPENWNLLTATKVGAHSNYEWLTRGYTGHEHLSKFDLINMNGRVYDPILGRMLSVDNFVQDATSTQSYNRYSYAYNNPLKYTDPSGEFLDPVTIGIAIGVLVGAYFGYKIGTSKAATGLSLVAYTIGGGLIGGVSGGLGAGVAARGGAFANTGAIVAGSFTNDVGLHILSGGENDVNVSFGFGSYNFNTNDFGYLGEKRNTGLQNFGYGLGAFGIKQYIGGADLIKQII